MSLRYSLLGLLSEGPASGYDISQRFKETLSAVWPASHPQIYTELGKLDKEGLVEVTEKGARGRKAYSITDQGKQELKEWLAHGAVDHTFRSEALIRSYFFWLMDAPDVLHYLEAEKKFFADKAAEYARYAAAKDRGEFGNTPQVKAARLTIEAGVRINQALAEWAEWASKRV